MWESRPSADVGRGEHPPAWDVDTSTSCNFASRAQAPGLCLSSWEPPAFTRQTQICNQSAIPPAHCSRALHLRLLQASRPQASLVPARKVRRPALPHCCHLSATPECQPILRAHTQRPTSHIGLTAKGVPRAPREVAASLQRYLIFAILSVILNCSLPCLLTRNNLLPQA